MTPPDPPELEDGRIDEPMRRRLLGLGLALLVLSAIAWRLEVGGLGPALVDWIGQRTDETSIGFALWRWLSELGNGTALVFLLIPVYALWPHRRRAQDLLGSALVVSVLVHIPKLVLGRQRPIHDEFDAWPSGHAGITLALALCFLSARTRWRFLPLLVALLVGASRVALRRHFPADVLGGLALGVFTAAIVLRQPLVVGTWIVAWRSRLLALCGCAVYFGTDVGGMSVFRHPTRLLFGPLILWVLVRIISGEPRQLDLAGTDGDS